ncbi:MAG: hypothetical protein F9K47_07620 [Burkholderiales bacterium]|nr:MAG: hypothetical protein F9K47_07620 [Burkholderiales bacterium]
MSLLSQVFRRRVACPECLGKVERLTHPAARLGWVCWYLIADTLLCLFMIAMFLAGNLLLIGLAVAVLIGIHTLLANWARTESNYRCHSCRKDWAYLYARAAGERHYQASDKDSLHG